MADKHLQIGMWAFIAVVITIVILALCLVGMVILNFDIQVLLWTLF
jgi:hypothetical protein